MSEFVQKCFICSTCAAVRKKLSFAPLDAVGMPISPARRQWRLKKLNLQVEVKFLIPKVQVRHWEKQLEALIFSVSI